MPSIREIAEKIACFSLVAFHDNPIAVRAQMQADIEQAIRNERERCAKITDSRARELQRMAMAPLLDDETVARFRCQSAICGELADAIRRED